MIPLASGSGSSSGSGSREILEGSRDPKGVPYVAKTTTASVTAASSSSGGAVVKPKVVHQST